MNGIICKSLNYSSITCSNSKIGGTYVMESMSKAPSTSQSVKSFREIHSFDLPPLSMLISSNNPLWYKAYSDRTLMSGRSQSSKHNAKGQSSPEGFMGIQAMISNCDTATSRMRVRMANNCANKCDWLTQNMRVSRKGMPDKGWQKIVWTQANDTHLWEHQDEHQGRMQYWTTKFLVLVSWGSLQQG